MTGPSDSPPEPSVGAARSSAGVAGAPSEGARSPEGAWGAPLAARCTRRAGGAAAASPAGGGPSPTGVSWWKTPGAVVPTSGAVSSMPGVLPSVRRSSVATPTTAPGSPTSELGGPRGRAASAGGTRGAFAVGWALVALATVGTAAGPAIGAGSAHASARRWTTAGAAAGGGGSECCPDRIGGPNPSRCTRGARGKGGSPMFGVAGDGPLPSPATASVDRWTGAATGVETPASGGSVPANRTDVSTADAGGALRRGESPCAGPDPSAASGAGDGAGHVTPSLTTWRKARGRSGWGAWVNDGAGSARMGSAGWTAGAVRGSVSDVASGGGSRGGERGASPALTTAGPAPAGAVSAVPDANVADRRSRALGGRGAKVCTVIPVVAGAGGTRLAIPSTEPLGPSPETRWPSGSRKSGLRRVARLPSNADVCTVSEGCGRADGAGGRCCQPGSAAASIPLGAPAPAGCAGVGRPKSRRSSPATAHSPRDRRRLILAISWVNRVRTGCSRSRISSSDQWKW